MRQVKSRIPTNLREKLTLLHILNFLIVFLLVLPIVYLVIRSTGAWEDVTQILFRTQTLRVFINTIILIVSVSITVTAVGTLLAWVTTSTNIPIRRLITVASVLPVSIPSFILATTLIYLYSPKGLLQQLIEPIGVTRLPDIYGFVGAYLALTLSTFPYVFLTVRSALLRRDPVLVESALSMGLGKIRVFLTLTLPWLRPALISGAMLSALYTLSDFGAVSLMRYDTMTSYIFIQYESNANRALAAGLTMPLIAIALVILMVQQLSLKERKYFRTGTGVSRSHKKRDLKFWKWLVGAIALIPAMLGLILPVSVLVWWSIQGSLSVESDLIALAEPFFNSVYVSTITALATVAGVILIVKRESLIGKLAENMAYVSFGMPGIVVALGIVFISVNWLPFLYQSLWLLIAAYGMLFVSGAVGSVKSSFMNMNPNIEEAAKSLGAKRVRIFTYITLPTVMPGIASGAIIVFLLTMRELPATLLLSPPGFGTIATNIWSNATEAFFTRTGLASLLLIIACGVPASVMLFLGTRTSLTR